jgi:hypothetical protein
LGGKLYIATAEENHCTSRYHKESPMLDVDRNVQVSPFQKPPAKVIFFGIAASNRKKFPIISIMDRNQVTVNSYQIQ